MARTEYVMRALWEKKATIHLLHHDHGLSQRQLAKLLGYSRWSIQKYLNSPEHKAFAALFTEDYATQELIKIWPELDADAVDGLNRWTLADILESLHERYPELKNLTDS